MLNRLSERYQKEIALGLINIFIIGGVASLKVGAFTVNHNTAYSDNHALKNNHLAFPSIQQNTIIEKLPALAKFDSEAKNEVPERRSRFNNVQLSQSTVSATPPIGGPGQPEMSSFKPVGSNNMVSPFTGDFSYNIPLLDVGGYPVNMFYNSGITMDQEASWVGLGWNINPGAVNRNMRGLPDDFDGSDVITKRQSIRPDKTWGVSGGMGIKFAGFPVVSTGIDVSLGLSFNNKLGVAADAGIHPALSLSSEGADPQTSGLSYGASVGVALNLNSRSGASKTPSISFSTTAHDKEYGTTASIGASYTYSSRLGLEGMHLNAGLSQSKRNAYETTNNKTDKVTQHSVSSNTGTLNSGISFVYPTILPSVQNIFTRKNYSLSFGVGTEWWALNPHVQIAGYYSESFISLEDKVSVHPAYGFLHYQDANKDPKAMLDFNRLNDGVYTPNSPAIALPIYTYDIFSITGEGTGGSFRAYRGDVGYMRDAYVQTKDKALSLGFDVAFGNTIHGGAELSQAFSPTTVNQWKENNAAAGVLNFRKSNNTYQAVYFKNPGEKAIPDVDFQNAIGAENLVRFKMSGVKSGTPLLLPTLVQYDGNKNEIGDKPLTALNTIKSKRDKRTQIITFLTAEEAARIGFDKKIYSYNTDNRDSNSIIFSADCNKAGIDSFKRTNEITSGSSSTPDESKVDSYRKMHHISEIDVLGTDGRKYVYGLPVYNTKQLDVSFSVNNTDGDATTGKSTYTKDVDDNVGDEENPGNTKGRDWYVQQEETPAYAHSFLLTELVSPNYVDVTGNGISEDDMGDAVKFNYSRFNKGIRWRTPAGDGVANYSEGLKTDPNDDKAHYIYGTREMWLLYSIESKNMIARFYVKNDRKDGKQALGQQGGVDETWGMQRLDKICLYSKGDLIKYGNAAKPIKTVQLFQSYKLCKGVDYSVGGMGKLTLDSIWMTYNGNSKKAKSRFIFSYPSDNNPDYDFNGSDRWGTYKPASENPNSLTNADYPYSVQDKVKADKYVAAWTMNKIILPSGGAINVEYESDDYAYVQNKKATSLQQIIGFGNSTNPNFNSPAINRLYTTDAAGDNNDNDYVYIKLPYSIKQRATAQMLRELTARYFENTSQLFMKLAVIMPSGKNIPGLAGAEIIPVYADIASFGLIDSVNGLSSGIAWVKVKKVENDMTPMAQQALQFLKQQLPGKAYKGYDLSESGGMKSVLLALAGMAASYKALKAGDDNVLKQEGKCKTVSLERCFARLTNPYMQKLGGGLRVKQVIINDNWNKMTGQYESTYGQEYKYINKELINNKLCKISSGVAAWEPSIGADENPHNEIMRFQNHNKGGPYDFGAIMMPLGEAFYPAPMVGYSRVEVLSIHRDTVKNLPTRQVTEFYTTKDFPFKSDYTSLIDPQAKSKYEPSPILQLLNLDLAKSVTLSQGFLVDMNDMNGKEKIQATYSALDSVTPVTYTQNFYNVEKATDNTYNFNHNLPTIASAEGKVGNSIIGRDIELMADFREHTSETITTNISPNFDLFFLGIFPVPLTNLLQPTIHEITRYRSASLLKIVNHYGVLDSVVVIDKGSMVSTKNLVYDAETGNPLLTRTNNEHNQPIYNFSYPAHWAYSGMGQAYKNIDATYSGAYFRHGQLVNMNDDLNTFLNTVLESGDELYVVAENSYGIDKDLVCDNNAVTDSWTTLAKNSENRIWAVNTGKASFANPQWIFMDRDGNPYNAKNVTMRIVRSGHRNMLDQNIGSVTSMNYPVKNNGQLKFNDATNIIQTGSATFKNHWRVDNSFYMVDSVVAVSTPMQVRKLTFLPSENLSLVDQHCNANNRSHNLTPFYNTAYFNSEYQSYGTAKTNSKHYVQSWAMYNFNSLPSDAVIVKARLTLNAHTSITPPNLYVHYQYLNLCNVNINHGSANPHHDVMHNDFYISRAKKDWNSNFNKDQWFDFYYNQNYIDMSNSVHTGPTELANKFYACYQKIGGGPLDVTLMVARMIQENKDPLKGYPTGIKLSKKANISSNLGDWERNVESPSICFEKPIIDIYYYSCSDNNTYAAKSNISPNVSTSCDPTFPQYYCTTYQHRIFCFSKFTQRKSVNPYAEGILGNWRVDTTFAYYGDRKESDPTMEVDTRTAGTIVNYKDFWNLSNTANGYLSRNIINKDVWVWNGTITQYNRKGYEIENKDPLGRFNAGLYGYNQHLPVAVANNSRVREALFDGFEDYDYSTAQNCITCKPHRSFNYSKDILNNLDATQHHTGLKSLRIDAGQSISIVAPVTDSLTADKGYGLRMRIDSVRYKDTTVTGRGTGLQGVYDQPKYKTGSIFTKTHPAHHFTRIDPIIQFNWGEGGPGYGIGQGPGQEMEPDHFTVIWTGKIQPKYSGLYIFTSTTDDGIKVDINNVNIFTSTSPNTSSGSIYLIAGNTYNITVNYNENTGYAFTNLKWQSDKQPFEIVPMSQFYPPGRYADANGAVTITNSKWCTRLDSVNARGNAVTDTFSLLQNKKMLVSAWVKEGGNDCKCSSYVKNNITVSFNGPPGQATVMNASGGIIEGWQRYEGIFTVPDKAVSVNVSFNNTTDGSPVYFDDIRIHPFNANMKSFVYHSSNLRLTSELDENNFATFYEYDDDGTLTRVKKETERGIKTITETRSAMQEVINQ